MMMMIIPNTNKFNYSSKLMGLLQESAVEHLTTYRQLVVRDLGSVFTIVTTGFEALYAYKHGDYQLCLQLSTQNVHTLLNTVLNFGIIILCFRSSFSCLMMTLSH